MGRQDLYLSGFTSYLRTMNNNFNPSTNTTPIPVPAGEPTPPIDNSHPTLPKQAVTGKIKAALLKLLQISEKDLHDVKVTIESDGHKIKVKIETETSKLRKEFDNLLHHKHFNKEAYDPSTGTRTLVFNVPDNLHTDVTHLVNEHVDIDDRISKVEERLKELGFQSVEK